MQELLSRIEILPDLAAERLLAAVSFDDIEKFCIKGSIFEMRFCGDEEDTYDPAIHPFRPTSTMFRLFFKRDFGISAIADDCTIGHNELKRQVAKSFETHFPSVSENYFDLRIIRKLREIYLYLRSAQSLNFSLELKFQTPNQTTRVSTLQSRQRSQSGVVCVSFGSVSEGTNQHIRGFFFVPLLDVMLDPTYENKKIRVPRNAQILYQQSTDDDDDLLGVKCILQDDLSQRERETLMMIKQIGVASVGFSELGPMQFEFTVVGNLEWGLVVQSPYRVSAEAHIYGYEDGWTQVSQTTRARRQQMAPRFDEASKSTSVDEFTGTIQFNSAGVPATLEFPNQSVKIAGDYEFFAIVSKKPGVNSKFRYFVSYRTVPPSVLEDPTNNSFISLFSDEKNNLPTIYRAEHDFQIPGNVALADFQARRVDYVGGNFAVVLLTTVRDPYLRRQVFVHLIEIVATGPKTVELRLTASGKTPTDPSQPAFVSGINAVAVSFPRTMMRFDFNTSTYTEKGVFPSSDRLQVGLPDRYLDNYFSRVSPQNQETERTLHIQRFN